jgi:hypothetical protein
MRAIPSPIRAEITLIGLSEFLGPPLFDGENMSRICRETNSTTFSCCRLTPRTPVVALYHHCWWSRKP